MRTHIALSLIGAAALAAVAGCTVKDIDQPALAGPSTLGTSITLKASPDTLIQDGASQSVITITAFDAEGRAKNIPLRADIAIDGVVQDFGRLNTKQPVANGSPLIYTAPPTSSLAAGQVAQTVTILISPTDGSAFDGRGEIARQVDIRLVPQGIILPTNPNLVAAFTFSPAAPQVLQTVSFDAATTLNNTVACGVACTYAWNFGDGTTASGQTATHQYRAINSYSTTLTVTDARGSTSVVTKQVPVSAGTPPSATFTTSPQSPGVDQDIFFNATQSAPASGRTITNYDWSFGDGSTATGVVTSHKYSAPGSYQVQLTTTDDAGSIGRSSPVSLQVGPTVSATPTADLVVTGSPKVSTGTPANFSAAASRPGSGANITSYTFDFGDGETPSVTTNPVQSHLYRSAGTFVVTVTVTDSLGRTASAQKTVTVAQ